jgi:hypothetical protein
VSRMHQMSLRVAQILDAKRPSRTGLWKPALGASAGLLVLVFGAAPYMPRLVAFENPTSNEVHTAQANTRSTDTSDAMFGNSATQAVAQRQSFSPQPKAIAAAFRIPSATVHPVKRQQVKTQAAKSQLAESQLKAQQVPSPMVMRAAVGQEEPAAPKVYVLRTTEYEVSSPTGQSIWTLCIWRVDANNPADRQLESAIVLSWI